jgi:hypothetical protein
VSQQCGSSKKIYVKPRLGGVRRFYTQRRARWTTACAILDLCRLQSGGRRHSHKIFIWSSHPSSTLGVTKDLRERVFVTYVRGRVRAGGGDIYQRPVRVAITKVRTRIFLALRGSCVLTMYLKRACQISHYDRSGAHVYSRYEKRSVYIASKKYFIYRYIFVFNFFNHNNVVIVM